MGEKKFQFIYWFPNIFIFNEFFLASYDAASDKIQFEVIRYLIFCLLYLVLFLKCRRHAVAQLIEALRYKLEVMGSTPNGVIGIFQ